MRIDLKIAETHPGISRTRAANLVKLGFASVNGVKVEKPSFEVSETDAVEIEIDREFYSLGALKLEKAFEAFPIDAKGKTALDLGCANGGFTGVLLGRGARRVYAVDVGENALPETLKTDPRVVFCRKNARELTGREFPEPIGLIATDLSFISLKLILPVCYRLLEEGGEAVALIKPQFEIGKASIGKSGVVKNPKLRARVVGEISRFAENLGFRVEGVADAPHPFPDKNFEYLLYLKRRPREFVCINSDSVV